MSRLEKPAGTSRPLHDLLAHRWSPRAFDDVPLAAEELRTVLEAARWSPSRGNTQPWAFVGGVHGSPGFDAVRATLTEGNGWAARAGALLVACHRDRLEGGDPAPHAAYDLGQAVAHLSVQAEALGLRVHQMAGFDPAAVLRTFGVPEGWVARTAVAVGRQAEPEVLGLDRRMERERAPRERRPLAATAYGAAWGEPLLPG